MGTPRIGQLAFTVSAVTLLVGCTKRNVNPPSPPPPRTCATGPECLLMRATDNAACGWNAENWDAGRWGTLSRALVIRQFEVFNLHATKDMVLTLKTRIETQAPNPPVETLTPIFLPALEKGTIKGGPDGVDVAGPGTFLGCEYVRNGNLIQRYEFVAEKICYVGDSDCAVAPPYAKPESRPSAKDEVARCDTACKTGDPSKCFVYPELSGPGLRELKALQTDLLVKSPPFGTDLTPLLSVLTAQAGPACSPRSLMIDSKSRFSAFGPSCRSAIATPQATPPELRSIVVNVPVSLAGTAQRYISTGPIKKFFLLQFEPLQTMSAEYYSTAGQLMDTDYLASASISDKVITLAGKKSFCALLPVGSEDDRRPGARRAGQRK